MLPVLQAEESLAMVDALMLTSEFTSQESREKLSRRLTALVKARVPDQSGNYPDDINPDRYPGQMLWGGKQVRAWLTMAGGFKKSQILE
jgi:hypothetical protein